ncbi:MAG: histidinol phosphate phosphatase domain-containing protein [Anaerolineae bacterium]
MTEAKRIDLHAHSFFTDGALLPSEICRRAVVMGYGALAITDHADASNLESILDKLVRFAREQAPFFPLTFIPGVELTHCPPQTIAGLARRARRLGAAIINVHGETPVEPTAPGSNRAAIECPHVDILVHPGFITEEEARLAAENGVYLEITSRRGHSLTNGYVAQVARAAGAKLVVNTDTHTPSDMIDQALARKVAAGAGLTPDEVEAATVTHPAELVQRALLRMGVLQQA